MPNGGHYRARRWRALAGTIGHYWGAWWYRWWHTRLAGLGVTWGAWWYRWRHTRLAGIGVTGRIVGREFFWNGSRLDRICIECVAAGTLLLLNVEKVMRNRALTPQLHFIVHRPSFHGGSPL